MSNLNFTNNINYNKFDCGSIHFSHDLKIKITDSIFDSNLSKSDGGALYVKNNI